MKWLLTLCAALAISLIAACNTIEGVGEDIRAAGNAIDNSAEENNTYGK
ncbi:MAG: entericidin A/B family lipoprotein [Rickettsiales bacterium]|nr:entericidin A/B family lipoprotein [Rickettsiales bacterium]